MCKVRTVRSARVYDVRSNLAQEFKKEMGQKLGLEVLVCDTPHDAIKDSDIIVTVTTSKEPVLQGEWLAPGSHVNAVGAHAPNAREIDDMVVKRSTRIAVDSLEAVLKEGGGAGDLTIPISKGVISQSQLLELGQIVRGEKTGRVDEKEITLFKSVGLALEDVSVALKVYRKAEKENVGQILEL
jgi:ornithine cyclodeaminase/alanine dehydrogenase-like protein (mu-crystallin family)